jgi:cytochrome P450
MLAGNETSSTALTWTLYALAKHPESQDKLREELMAVEDERPSMSVHPWAAGTRLIDREDLAALPYMDAVIREVLRLWSPAPNTIRKATQDVIIPLSTPIEGRDGKMIESIALNKGTQLFIRTSPLLLGSAPS